MTTGSMAGTTPMFVIEGGLGFGFYFARIVDRVFDSDNWQ